MKAGGQAGTHRHHLYEGALLGGQLCIWRGVGAAQCGNTLQRTS